MFDLFDFDLPGAVTEQLERRLNSMPSSTLTEQALQHLGEFLEQHKLRQGVYQIVLKDEVVYVGKATNAKERRKPLTLWRSPGISPSYCFTASRSGTPAAR
ncbi:MAG: hypothetical protein ACLQM8_21290 [Limisphaerales bacterium]